MSSSVTRASIQELVVKNLAEILEKTPSDIALDTPFGDLGADSLALIELVESIEEALASESEGFRIDDEDLENLSCVSDAVNYVANKLQVA